MTHDTNIVIADGPDRCAINGYCPACDTESCNHEYAPHFEDAEGVHCGCTGCAQNRRDDYGCDHAIDAGCGCAHLALFGPDCGDISCPHCPGAIAQREREDAEFRASAGY